MEQLIPNVPIIISDAEPSVPSKSGFLVSDWKWFNTSNNRWYDHNGGWVMQGDEPEEYAPVEHTHDHLDDLADIVTLLGNGVTGTRTIQGHTLTFNHGVLVDYQPPE